jgi:hypothetical protein
MKVARGEITELTIINGQSQSVFSQIRRMALYKKDHWDQFNQLRAESKASNIDLTQYDLPSK